MLDWNALERDLQWLGFGGGGKARGRDGLATHLFGTLARRNRRRHRIYSELTQHGGVTLFVPKILCSVVVCKSQEGLWYWRLPGLPSGSITTLPNELLVEMLDWCRLVDEYSDVDGPSPCKSAEDGIILQS